MPRYERGLLLYNGNDDAQEIERKLTQTVSILARVVKSLSVTQTASLEELHEVCQAEGPEVDVFFILGGDGTIHECINALAPLQKRPVIGILPGGTCNDFSRVLQLPQNLEQAARMLTEAEEYELDAGQTDDQYFLNFWGIGLVTETSTNIDSGQKSRLGVLSYFISALKTISNAEAFSYTVTIDGKEITGEAVMIMVMNGSFIGTRQVPVPSIDLQDGLLDVVIVKNSNLTLFKELITMNRPFADESRLQEFYHNHGKRITVKTDKPEEVDMDGEVKGETPDTIKVLPRHFTFLKGNIREEWS